MSLIGTAAAALGMSAASQLAGPAINGLGNLISGGTWRQSGSQIAQNAFNSQEAQKQRDWEKMMSDTSYQRAVADMQKAGLNPAMLYASGGNGASTPSGASGTTSGMSSGRAMDLIGNVGSLLNSVNTARYLDHKTRNNEFSNSTTTEMYNAAGKLFKTVVQQSAGKR